MKNVITGISFALVAATASAAVPMMGASRNLGHIGGQMKSFMVYVGLSGVWSRKNIKVRTEMKTAYRAGYLYAPNNTNVLAGVWGTAQPNNYARSSLSRVLGVHHAGVASAGGGLVPANANAAFFTTGVPPRYWHTTSADNGRDYGDNANDVAESSTQGMTWALFAPSYNAALPNNKAWVQPENYTVHGGNVTEFEYANWGVRLELGLGYCLMDNFSMFLMLGHKFEFDHKDSKNVKKDVFIETKGSDKKFRAANGTTDLTAKLDLASFAHNNSRLASKVKITATVKETFGIMGGIDWRPSPMLSLSLRTGVRRYQLEVLYQGGDYAYPGTTAYFTDAYWKDGGGSRLLISQEGETRKMKGTEWPVVFGAAARFVVMGVHCVGIGVDYTSFESKLSVPTENFSNKGTNDKDDSDKQTPSELKLSNPYESVATDAQIKTGTGIHQFAAQGDVTNTLNTTVEVQDLTVSASYMLTL